MYLQEQARLLAKKAERAVQDTDVDVDELYSTLDLLKAAECSIRSAINARAPIHRILAPELLLAIFAFVPTAAYDPEDHDQTQRVCGPYLLSDTSELLPITQVCKFWRSLAFDTSSLWSSISCADPNEAVYSASDLPHCFPVHFSRIPASCIGVAPLYLHAVAPDTWPHAATTSAFLSKYGHLVEELHISLDASARQFLLEAGPDEEPLPPSLSFPATSLRRLAIHGWARCEEPWADISRTLFGGVPLNLSSLAMIDTPFLPTNSMGPSFTRLLLSRVAFSGGSPLETIPIRSLLRFLAGNPSLEQVYLDGVANAEDLPTLPTVSLPHVRKLAIRWSARGAPQLLSGLRLPETCLLRIRAGRSTAEHELLRSALSQLVWAGTKAHVLWDRGMKVGRINLLGHVSLQVINRSAGGLRIDLMSSGTEPSSNVPQDIRSFLSASPFVTAEEVWLSGTDVAGLLSESDQVISALSALTTLHILNLSSLDLQHAGILWPNMSSQEITLDQLPNLTCLHYCLPHNQYSLDLVPLLSARWHASHPLARLFISIPPNPESPSSHFVQDVRCSVIRSVSETFVSEVVEVGEALYDRPGFAWWSVVPRECTAHEECYNHWPVWAEGITGAYDSGHPGTLSGRLDVAFGTNMAGGFGLR